MNPTVAWLTARTLLGRRRIWMLVLVPLVLLVLAGGVRVLVGRSDGVAWPIVAGFGVGTLIPLVTLLAGTGAIAPEIDDGSIVYLLSKPISRFTIVGSKLAVAGLVAMLLGPLPVVLATLLLAERPGTLAPPLAAASALATAAYCALFLLLSVLTRAEVVVGLLYAIVWETTVGNLIPGARALSVRQWSLAVAQWLLGPDEAARLGVSAAVGPVTGLLALTAVTVGSTVYAGVRLRTLRLVSV